jgi:hypothetical protein
MEKYPSFIHTLSDKHGFTRSAKYEQAWMFDHSMGPNPLWLTKWLRWIMNEVRNPGPATK